MLLNIVLNTVFHLHLKRLSITACYFKWYFFFFLSNSKNNTGHHREKR